MSRLLLRDVDDSPSQSAWGEAADFMAGAGIPVPRILKLFDFKPQWTRHLARFTEGVMRGPSPLAPGERELIAAFTSAVNHCPF
jgi:alkylhydroperoxidase family enzyme